MYDPTLNDLIEELMAQSSIGNEMDNRPKIKEAKMELIEYIDANYKKK